MSAKKTLIAFWLLLCLFGCDKTTQAVTVSPSNNNALQQAWQQQRSDVQVRGSGIVSRVLADDTKGSQHQRFILKINEQQTLLVAHNIDLAPRLPNLRPGDLVEFYGEYEWNNRGGVLHWTHKDPRGKHAHGWLRYQGQQYW
ncbi:DUF3465 domain-containing protein [Gilvimarinus polysaccharolyticus]|uniref:DUF3465 domain-containing protein n=1 Tax=Gilvimarinus polysaccharolyticus TaxID=863921 RepID=UPI0009FC889B|nr:DUF3465 domain-containing protein [Gilvimarinus polysaccharolyticus]